MDSRADRCGTVLRVMEWERFQHYRDRSPTWIKVYGELLDNAVFLTLPECAQAQLVKLWLLASRCENRIDDNPEFLRARLMTKKLYVELLISCGFMERVASSDVTHDDGRANWASRYVAQDVRDRVIAKHEGRCAKCGSPDDIEIDHIVPVSQGGDGREENLQALCRGCNRKKRSTTERFATQIRASAEQDAPYMRASAEPRARPRARGEREGEREGKKERTKSGAEPIPPSPDVLAVAAHWRATIGNASDASIAKHLAATVLAHGPDLVSKAISVYASPVEGPGPNRPRKLAWFAEDVQRYVSIAAQPLVDPTGVLTERGRRLTNPAA